MWAIESNKLPVFFWCLAGKPIILITTYSNRDLNLWSERSSMKLKEGRNTNSIARKPNHGECCEDTSQQWPYSYFEGVQMPSTCHCAMTSNSNNPFQAASEKEKNTCWWSFGVPNAQNSWVFGHQSPVKNSPLISWIPLGMMPQFRSFT